MYHLQSLHPLGQKRCLAAYFYPGCGGRTDSRGACARQLKREGAPLGVRWKRGEFNQAVGVSRGGRTTKIHCLADGRGRIVAVALTPGNMADITMAMPMLEALAPAKRLIADKAYDADRLRTWLQDKGIDAVIPVRAARAIAYPLNRAAYRRRNVIERMFGRLKNGKRIATRYDRLAINYLAAIALVATITQWLG
ncbi:IS5 family transposase [Microvirga sp. VF16]|nr:IS5 family transposase [Microvirga sp. VF16]